MVAMVNDNLPPPSFESLSTLASPATSDELILLCIQVFDVLSNGHANLSHEAHRLRTDAAYYNTWCGNIASWYDGWEHELMRMRLGIGEWRDPDVE